MTTEVYSPLEVARAVGVAVDEVVALVGRGSKYIAHAEAVQVGRLLAARRREQVSTAPQPLFRTDWRRGRSTRVPLVLSGTLHATLLATIVFIATLGLAPTVATQKDEPTNELIHLVFTSVPGPGGGGGGGGLEQKTPPPKAMREGHRAISSPIPERQQPKMAQITIPEPKPLKMESLPPIMAPVIAVAADPKTRVGVLEQTPSDAESNGPGHGGGAGTGAGTGLGSGSGSGIGPGAGGGTGGGPYRPGSGIEPPRLLREVRADYTEDARRRGISGDVVLEIVVRSDGAVGDVTVQHGLGYGLDERAVQAVKQWQFSPAHRQGIAVDVIVEVAVEFKLR